MAKKTVDNQPTNQEAADDLNAALAPRTSGLPVPKIGEVSGEIDSGDIDIPRLAIAYGVGALAKVFAHGDLVLNKEYLIGVRYAKDHIGLFDETKTIGDLVTERKPIALST